MSSRIRAEAAVEVTDRERDAAWRNTRPSRDEIMAAEVPSLARPLPPSATLPSPTSSVERRQVAGVRQ
jgi:hypothetical protein